MGRLHLGVMNAAHDLAMLKAAVRLGCSVKVEERQILSAGYNPHLAIVIKLSNEGELAAEGLNGQWKILHPDPAQKRVFLLQKDFLGGCEVYSNEYLFQQSCNWRREGIAFDVEIELFYSLPSLPTAKNKTAPYEKERYKAIWRYDASGRQMVKLSG